MNYTRTDNEAETTLEITGTLDAVTAPDLRAVVDQLVTERRSSVTLELSSLRLIDSSGVGVIMSLFKRIRANGGQGKIVGLPDQPRPHFRPLRPHRVFPLELRAPPPARVPLRPSRGCPRGFSCG